MRLLLDTHVFLWMFLHREKIRPKTWAHLENPENDLFLSAASAWEIAVKSRLGKLALPGSPALYVPRRARESHIQSLSISEEHALAVADLPLERTDPFDRMLAAQAQLESLTIVTGDPAFERYDVKRMAA